MKIDRLGHDGVRIESQGLTIYIDPYHINGGPVADLVLVTHGHFDHLSPEDLEKIVGEETIVVAPKGCVTPGVAKTMNAGEKKKFKGVKVETVPAYNVDKKFHPKKDGHVGYILEVEGERIYHAGDTDLIEEMASVECDIAFLPVSGTYVMTAEEAAEAALTIKPKVAIPMHYDGGVVGSEDDANRFAALLEGSAVKVEIKQKVE